MLSIFHSPRFLDHLTPPGHPERPERAEAMGAVVERFKAAGGRVAEPRAAGDADLLRIHTEAYIAAMRATRGKAVMLDPDTFTSPESEEVARLAAGAVLSGVDVVLDGPAGTRALAVVRPPGHHAEADRAMGFCLYNNIAVGAAYARTRGCARVAIVDYDVHHGNGTQWAFYEDPTVFFISSHQYPYYPGTGAADETGRGAGLGYTLNLPLRPVSRDADVMERYQREALPVLDRFRPDLMMISAGFDAHERDPLAGCRMTTVGFRALTALLIEAAGRVCQGRVVLTTEGGYDLTALDECLQAVIDVTR
jgi:acetoin utilization deacetylase AcuC-like enzyme